jgi:hypothetical protein
MSAFDPKRTFATAHPALQLGNSATGYRKAMNPGADWSQSEAKIDGSARQALLPPHFGRGLEPLGKSVRDTGEY